MTNIPPFVEYIHAQTRRRYVPIPAAVPGSRIPRSRQTVSELKVVYPFQLRTISEHLTPKIGRCDKKTSHLWLTRRRRPAHRLPAEPIPPPEFRLLDLPSTATTLICRFLLTAPWQVRVYCPPFPPNVIFNNCNFTADAHIRLLKDVLDIEPQLLYVCRRAYEEGVSSLYAANTFEYGNLESDNEDLNEEMQEIEQFDREHSRLLSDEESSYPTPEPANYFSVMFPEDPPRRRYRRQHYFSVLPLRSRDMIQLISIASSSFCFNQFHMFRSLRRVIFTHPRYIYWERNLSTERSDSSSKWSFFQDIFDDKKAEEGFLWNWEDVTTDNVQQLWVERRNQLEQDREIHAPRQTSGGCPREIGTGCVLRGGKQHTA